jgi:hypothetical protein
MRGPSDGLALLRAATKPWPACIPARVRAYMAVQGSEPPSLASSMSSGASTAVLARPILGSGPAGTESTSPATGREARREHDESWR